MLGKGFSFDLAGLGVFINHLIANPHLLLQVDDIRILYSNMRIQSAKDQGLLSGFEDSKYSVNNTVVHNLENLDAGIAGIRPWALLGPLLGVDYVSFNLKKLKVLIIGPRTEAELFLYQSRGFLEENIFALDLISYSESIVKGDMHKIPFDSDFFDIVVFSWCLGYSEYQQKAIDEAVRVVKDKGMIAIGEQWDPTPIESTSSILEKSRGYTLRGTETLASNDLISLFGERQIEVVFSTEPRMEDKNRVGWINVIVEVSK